MMTLTGTALLVVVPSPNWPNPLYPQQYVSTAVVTAQVWDSSAAIDAQACPLGTNKRVVLDCDAGLATIRAGRDRV